MITWGASLAQTTIDPSTSKIDFDTPVNRDGDFHDGWMIGGRVDFHPLGHLKMEQGDFKRETKATIGVAAYTWSDDEDTYGGVTPTDNGLDTVTGFEVSGAFRGAGFSLDAEYNLFQAEVFDNTFTGGLYRNGETDLENLAVEAGYMVVPKTLEIVARITSYNVCYTKLLRSSARSMSAATACTSSACRRSSAAPCSAKAPLSESTNPSPEHGRTSSAAAAPSGATSTLC